MSSYNSSGVAGGMVIINKSIQVDINDIYKTYDESISHTYGGV